MRNRRGFLPGASTKATATRRSKNESRRGRRFEFRRGMHSTARRSTMTTTSHARGPIYIRLTSRRDRETPHTRLQINGGLGAHRAALFFFTARENAFDCRDTFGWTARQNFCRRHAHAPHARDVAVDRPSLLLQLSTSGDAAARRHRHRAIDGYRQMLAGGSLRFTTTREPAAFTVHQTRAPCRFFTPSSRVSLAPLFLTKRFRPT